MSSSLRLSAEVVKTKAFGDIAVGYTLIGDITARPIRILYIQNQTDAALMFSLNGVDDHFPLLDRGYFTIDITTNKTVSQGFFVTKGQGFYVKQLGIPTQGSVYVSCFYADV